MSKPTSDAELREVIEWDGMACGVMPEAAKQWLADREAMRQFVAALGKCEVCEAPATRVYIIRHQAERWELEYCDAHEYLGPECNSWTGPVDSEEAPALRAMLARLAQWEGR